MIEFESVTKRYRDGTTAVRDLSLRIPSDQITVLVGPSGCGKTTSLRMINRMLEPTSGRILWDGEPIKSRRRTKLRRQMGYVIQNGGLFPHRTVIENISTVPGLLRWNKSKTRTRAHELLEMVGLDRKLAQRYPAQLSGGQQQRVGVARALAADPIVLLMDEPFSAVDPVVRAELHDQFLELQHQIGKTIVMITHDIDEAINLGDQVAIMRVGGDLAQAGTPQQLLDEPADEFVEGFVGKDRGYRGLSFVPASEVKLDSVQAVRDPATVTSGRPVLVVESDARPVGWADVNRPGHVLDLGTTFNPETDAMRVALDSALTSPVGLAVAVADNGRFLGVATAAEILEQVRSVRASIADAISERTTHDENESRDRPEPVEGPEPDEERPEPSDRPELVEGPEPGENRPEPVEGPEPSDRPELVEGPESGEDRPEPSDRPEPVEGPEPGEDRPELVEGPAPGENRPEPSDRPEPVEGPEPGEKRPEPVEGRDETSATDNERGNTESRRSVFGPTNHRDDAADDTEVRDR